MRFMMRILLRIAVITAFTALLSVASGAADSHRISISECTPESITCSIQSTTAGENVTAVIATNLNGQMSEVKMESFQTDGTPFVVSKTLAQPYDSVQIMLLDAETFAPLCESAGNCTVRFMDHNGQMLSEQTILPGRSAIPPVLPEREGYVFVKWDVDFAHIFEDVTIAPVYVEDTADNIFVMPSVDAGVGEEFHMLLRLDGTVDLCAFDLRLEYGEALEYVGMNSALSLDVLANHVPGGRYIRLNYESTKDRKTGANVIDLTFRAKTPGAAAVRITPVSIIRVDPLDASRFLNADYTLCEGVVRIS